MAFNTPWVSAEEAVGQIRPGQRVVLPLCCGLPQTLMEALTSQAERLRGLEIVSGLQITYPFLDEALEGAFTFRTWQCAPAIRRHLARGTVQYIPMRQGDAVKVFSKTGPWPVDVALIQVSPPDAHGYCSLGVSIGHTLPLALEAELVIAEVNPFMPRVLGNSFIHLSQIHLCVASERPLLEYPSHARPGERERTIAAHVAELIPDGATLQIGIGAIPEAILEGLEGKRDLRFFAMGVDKIVGLAGRGVVRPDREGAVQVTEILGSRQLFDFVNDNPMVQGRTLPETINPRAVGAIPRFCSIISAIEVDLTGQVNAETVRGRQVSAVGGSFDFVQGALFSEGGLSIIAMTSTTSDGKISRIVPRLEAGAAVTTPRHSVRYVVTEYGVADLWGRSLKERADALARIAHPAFREGLEREAAERFG